MAGVCYRFASKPPPFEEGILEKMKTFVSTWCAKNLKPLDSCMSFDEWIEATPYPLWRKKQLREKFEKVNNIFDPKLTRVKSFIKDESYPSYKHSRPINSRTDEFKCLAGPLFKSIEEQVYKLGWFIKKIPVRDRPDYILERVFQPGASFIATDYTAFETHFRKELMEACEFILYEYMFQNLPSIDKMKLRYVLDSLAGTNVCEFKNFTVDVEATRMSGEMNTSLGNGFSNLMFMLFMCHLKDIPEPQGVIEGDDGLFSIYGDLDGEDFLKIGMTIKLEHHEKLSEASFCGLIFDEYDKKNVTNPLEVLAEFGWSTHQYVSASDKKLKELLKAKALSLWYQYPACPILEELAHYALRQTTHIQIRPDKLNMNLWEREQFNEAFDYFKKYGITRNEVGMNTRLMVENLYGITVDQQIEIENYLRAKNGLEPLNIPSLSNLYHKDVLHYTANYLDFVDVYSPARDYPHMSLHNYTRDLIDVDSLKRQ